jgi:ABC-type cobalamin/Fe3+-siderophores transport system ATPase subunit
LIEGISLVVRPGELVGLMGPSGAGKSTLLKALAGYVRPSRGSVLLNGEDLARDYASFRGQIGFVPQEDIVHRDLTVREALRYAARLRLPADYGDEEIRQRVANVLAQLDLTAAADVLIGSPSGTGTSGGQRRRVNLAMELLTDPPILLLDEPTSGLSSEDALLVMQVLRKLANQGKTIVASIHQPGRDAFRVLDRVMVVARDAGSNEPGKLAYDGPAYPDSILFFSRPAGSPANPGAEREPSPDDLLKGLARRPVREWVALIDAEREKAAKPTSGRAPLPRVRTPHPVPQDLTRSSFLQCCTLVCRAVAIKRKDRWNTTILLAQAPVIALLIVLVFGRQVGRTDDLEHWAETRSGLASTAFILGLAALWFGCSNAVREIVAEWRVYERERMVNLRLGPYIASKLATLGALCLLQCVALLAVVHLGVGLSANWLVAFAIVFLASGVGMALGLVISAAARTSEVAVALLPLSILPLLIFGGALQPIHKMHPSLQWFCQGFPSRWAFEGLVVLEADERPRAPSALGMPPRLAERSEAPVPRDMAEDYFPTRTARMGPRASVIALSGTFVFLVTLIAVILRSRDLF